MAKDVNKYNLSAFAKEHLHDTAAAVSAGFLDAKTAKGHVRELFYLSATFGLGLQDEAREIIREMDKRL